VGTVAVTTGVRQPRMCIGLIVVSSILKFYYLFDMKSGSNMQRFASRCFNCSVEVTTGDVHVMVTVTYYVVIDHAVNSGTLIPSDLMHSSSFSRQAQEHCLHSLQFPNTVLTTDHHASHSLYPYCRYLVTYPQPPTFLRGATFLKQHTASPEREITGPR